MPGRFSALVERCKDRVQQVASGEIHLKVRITQPEVVINAQSLRLSPAEYLILRFLAQHALNNRPPIDGYASAVDAIQKLAQVVYDEHDENDFSDWRYKILPPKNGLDDINERWIIKNVSSMRTKLRNAGPITAALVPFLPESQRFSLDLPAGNIRLES